MKLCLRCNQYFDDREKVCPEDAIPLTPVGSDSLIGSLLAGHYLIESIISKGSSSVVYKAKQVERGEIIAVKVLNNGSYGNSIDRFLREARAASKLRNPHIIHIWDSGVTSKGQPFFVMDYLQGITLGQLIRERGGLHLNRTLAIVKQIAEALAEAHKHGIIHRDLKPDNIVLQETDSGLDYVKLLDFGIAASPADSPQIEKPTTVPGSPAYMSPEQCQGFELDQRSDIYSLGIVVFEMLTGKRPFNGEEHVSLMFLHVSQPPLKLSDACPQLKYPLALEQVIAKALAKKPSQRQANVKDFYSELESAAKVALQSAPQLPQANIESHVFDEFSVPVSDRLTDNQSKQPIVAKSVAKAEENSKNQEIGKNTDGQPLQKGKNFLSAAASPFKSMALATQTLVGFAKPGGLSKTKGEQQSSEEKSSSLLPQQERSSDILGQATAKDLLTELDEHLMQESLGPSGLSDQSQTLKERSKLPETSRSKAAMAPTKHDILAPKKFDANQSQQGKQSEQGESTQTSDLPIVVNETVSLSPPEDSIPELSNSPTAPTTTMGIRTQENVINKLRSLAQKYTKQNTSKTRTDMASPRDTHKLPSANVSVNAPAHEISSEEKFKSPTSQTKTDLASAKAAQKETAANIPASAPVRASANALDNMSVKTPGQEVSNQEKLKPPANRTKTDLAGAKAAQKETAANIPASAPVQQVNSQEKIKPPASRTKTDLAGAKTAQKEIAAKVPEISGQEKLKPSTNRTKTDLPNLKSDQNKALSPSSASPAAAKVSAMRTQSDLISAKASETTSLPDSVPVVIPSNQGSEENVNKPGTMRTQTDLISAKASETTSLADSASVVMPSNQGSEKNVNKLGTMRTQTDLINAKASETTSLVDSAPIAIPNSLSVPIPTPSTENQEVNLNRTANAHTQTDLIGSKAPVHSASQSKVDENKKADGNFPAWLEQADLKHTDKGAALQSTELPVPAAFSKAIVPEPPKGQAKSSDRLKDSPSTFQRLVEAAQKRPNAYQLPESTEGADFQVTGKIGQAKLEEKDKANIDQPGLGEQISNKDNLLNVQDGADSKNNRIKQSPNPANPAPVSTGGSSDGWKVAIDRETISGISAKGADAILNQNTSTHGTTNSATPQKPRARDAGDISIVLPPPQSITLEPPLTNTGEFGRLPVEPRFEEMDEEAQQHYVKQRYESSLARIKGKSNSAWEEAMADTRNRTAALRVRPRGVNLAHAILVGSITISLAWACIKIISVMHTVVSSKKIYSTESLKLVRKEYEQKRKVLEKKQIVGGLTKQETEELNKLYVNIAKDDIRAKKFDNAILLLQKVSGKSSSVNDAKTLLKQNQKDAQGKKVSIGMR